VKDLNPLAASARIQNEFEGRGWRLATPFPAQLVREILQDGGVPNPAKLVAKVPRVFFSANNVTRSEVHPALARALNGYRVVEAPASGAVTNQFVSGKVEYVDKKIEINTGQFAGNIDSPNARVRVGRQQQAQMTPADEVALREHLDDPEVQDALALDVPADDKAAKVGGVLAKAANVALDKAMDFAAKVVTNALQPG